MIGTIASTQANAMTQQLLVEEAMNASTSKTTYKKASIDDGSQVWLYSTYAI